MGLRQTQIIDFGLKYFGSIKLALAVHAAYGKPYVHYIADIFDVSTIS